MMTRILVLTLVGSLALVPESFGVEPDRTPTRATLEEMSTDLARMQAGLAQAGSALAQGAAMYQRYDQQLVNYLQLAARAGGGDADALAQLPAATKRMEETRMSFNLQYLQLQNQMQHENRQYTTISNVLKTKHDTVKNSINNVR